MKRNL
jgi:20S proteasome subunit beta 4